MVMLDILTGLVSWGTGVGDILQSWADMQIFYYVLPFLLIFAVVFGILEWTALLGENKGVHVVVALSVGLLSLQWDYVPTFFATIFPYAGIGIAILLVAMILMGLFIPSDKEKRNKWMIVFFILGALVALVVILSSLATYNWWGSFWWDEYWPMIVVLLVAGGLVAVVIATSKSGGKKARNVLEKD